MKRKSILEVLNNKHGAALVTVLVVFLTLVVIVMSATMMAQGNFQRAQKTANFSSAYYVAETGLNETYEQLVVYYEMNKSTATFDETFSESFLTVLGAVEGVKETIYDTKIMNETARSEVTFEFFPEKGEEGLYLLSSTGYVGENSRTVAREIKIDIEIQNISENYQPDANLAIDLTTNPSPITGSGSFSFKGPVITNKPIIFPNSNGIVVSGPIVTNNKITLNGVFKFKTDEPKDNTVIITSNEIYIDNNNNEQTFPVIMLKPGGIIKVHSGRNKKIKVNYLFVPNAPDNYKIFDANASNFVDVEHIIYYNPVNFDPYKADIVDGVNIRHIFGSDPVGDNPMYMFDYRDYFDEDFVLDNMDKVDEFVPNVKMPNPKPKYEMYYPYGTQLKEAVKDSDGNTVIDTNNNFIAEFKWWPLIPSFDVALDLDIGETTRSYNSMIMKGSENASNPSKIYFGDRNLTIITKKLTIINHVEFIGSGSLRIIVVGDGNRITSNDLNLSPRSIRTRDTLNGPFTDDPTKLQIVIYETAGTGLYFNAIDAGNNSYYHLSIFSENLNLKGGGDFRGNFVSAKGHEVSVSGAGSTQSQLIFAPNANINVSGSGTVKGVVVGKDYSFSGDTGIEFETLNDKILVDELLVDFIQPFNPNDTQTGKAGKMISYPIREVDK